MKLFAIHLLLLACLLLGLSACDSSKEPEPKPESAAMNEPQQPPNQSAADAPPPKDGDAVTIPQEIQPQTAMQKPETEQAEPEPIIESGQPITSKKAPQADKPTKPSKPVLPAFAAQQTTSDSTFYLRFLATGEAFYTEIKLENGILSYTYFVDENKRCEKWVQSAPCWKESDLKTISMALPDEDLDNLYTIAKESGIFKIKADKVGGAKEGQRYYAQKLEVRIDGKEKKLTYQSFPGSRKKPEAFNRLETALVEYARDLPH